MLSVDTESTHHQFSSHEDQRTKGIKMASTPKVLAAMLDSIIILMTSILIGEPFWLLSLEATIYKYFMTMPSNPIKRIDIDDNIKRNIYYHNAPSKVCYEATQITSSNLLCFIFSYYL